ncbi:MAG: hypothetical protein NXI07_13065, partial [bacterium]|nr:hypothetical protein [bacterium]
MKTPRIPEPLLWIWKRTAALIAMVLIVIAFVIGLRLGNTGESTVTSHAQGHANPSTDSDSGDTDPQMYTCSMHPSVRLPDPDAKCPICFM